MRISPLLASLLILATTTIVSAQPDIPKTENSEDSYNRVDKVGGRDLDDWIRDLSNPDPTIREEAIVAMVRFGETAKDSRVIDVLLRRCLDPDHSPRTRAVQALSMVQVPETDIPRIVDQLATRMVEDPQVVIRYYAGVSLTRLGEHCGPVLDKLIRVTQQSRNSWRVKQVAYMCIATAGKAEKGPSDPRAIGAAYSGLDDNALQVKIEAIKTLSYLGRPGNATAQRMIEQKLRGIATARVRSRNPSEEGRNKIAAMWAWIALMAITDVNTEAVKAISSHLKHEDARIRVAAIGALGMINDRARFAIPDLLETLKDPDPNVVVAAITTLANIEDPGLKTKEALADISKATKPEEYLVKMDEETREGIQKIAKKALDHINGVKAEK